MKVLIVLGGDAPGVELLKACADEADFSIAADRGLEAFDAAGLEPDMLVGDMDSVSQNVLARYESRLSEDRLNCIKNDTDCEYALNLAISRGATEIVLLGALGGRLDHALANLMMVVRAARRGVWAEIRAEGVQIVRINESYTLTGAKGSTVSLLPLGACADGAQNAEQYDYLAWQRGVRVREMLSQAGTNTPRAKERLLAGGHELNIIAEAIGMGRCTVSDIE